LPLTWITACDGLAIVSEKQRVLAPTSGMDVTSFVGQLKYTATLIQIVCAKCDRYTIVTDQNSVEITRSDSNISTPDWQLGHVALVSFITAECNNSSITSEQDSVMLPSSGRNVFQSSGQLWDFTLTFTITPESNRAPVVKDQHRVEASSCDPPAESTQWQFRYRALPIEIPPTGDCHAIISQQQHVPSPKCSGNVLVSITWRGNFEMPVTLIVAEEYGFTVIFEKQRDLFRSASSNI
jgi:hypothetical protein